MAALKRELDGRMTMLIAGSIGVLGAVGTGLGLWLSPVRGLAAYLAAWTAVASIAIGGYVILLLGYAANARWPAVIRRIGDAAASSLVALAVLMIPLLVWIGRVWPWVTPRTHELARAVEAKSTYLSVGSFLARQVIYWLLLVIPAELLRRWSLRRDRDPERQVPHGVDALNRERALASVALLATGLVLTFAAFDWLMSLQPDWWSSAFGFYFITEALQAGLAATVVLAWAGVATRSMPLRPAHFRAMGRLLHGFTILWMYIGFFQALLIQIANLPKEVTFYVVRLYGGWQVVTVVLIVAKFVVPFVLLFSRRQKRRAGYMAAIAILLVLAQYLETWWLVIPTLPSPPLPAWTDLSAICAIGGLTVAFATWRMRGASLLPIGDPYLDAGMAYESKY